MEKPHVLLLVDGHALVYRAYHAVPAGFMTSKGEPTNAVFGFTSMLLKALEDVQPDYAAVTFDRSAPTFRHVEYADYKATRPRMADELRQQFGRVREVVQAFNIPIFELDGYEADDLLGCLARQAEAAEVDTMIMTGDLDTLQLVTPRVRVMAPRGRISDTVVYDQAAVRERYGLEPVQIPDFKALSGDASDNIKGVPGIGPKTASKLLGDFGSIEDLYKRIDEVPAKQRTPLVEHEDLVRRNKRWTTIDRAAPCILSLDECRLEDYDREKALALFQEMEFRSLLPKLPRSRAGEAAARHGVQQMSLFGEAPDAAAPAVPAADTAVELIADAAGLDALVARLREAGSFLLHPVATARNAIDFDLAGFAFATSETDIRFVATTTGDDVAAGRLNETEALERLRPLLEDEAIKKTAHNAKAVYTLLGERGVRLAGLEWDTMIAAYLLNQSIRSAGVRDLVFQQTGREIEGTAALAPKGGSLLTV